MCANYEHLLVLMAWYFESVKTTYTLYVAIGYHGEMEDLANLDIIYATNYG